MGQSTDKVGGKQKGVLIDHEKQKKNRTFDGRDDGSLHVDFSLHRRLSGIRPARGAGLHRCELQMRPRRDDGTAGKAVYHPVEYLGFSGAGDGTLSVRRG